MKNVLITRKMMLAIMVMLANLSLCYAQSSNEKVSLSSTTPTTPTAPATSDKWSLFVVELGYTANSFSEPGATGSYGAGMTALYSISGSKFGVGFHWGIGMNTGLVETAWHMMPIKLGPTLGYHFKDQFFIAMPVNVVCGIGMGDAASTSWAMEIAPSVYLGKKWGVYFGPNIYIPFSGGDINCGFRAGIQI